MSPKSRSPRKSSSPSLVNDESDRDSSPETRRRRRNSKSDSESVKSDTDSTRRGNLIQQRLLKISKNSVDVAEARSEAARGEFLKKELENYIKEHKRENGHEAPTEEEVRKQIFLPKVTREFKEPIKVWKKTDNSTVPGWNKDLLPEDEVVRPPDWRPPTPPKVDLTLTPFIQRAKQEVEADPQMKPVEVKQTVIKEFKQDATERDLRDVRSDEIILVITGCGYARFTKRAFLKAKAKREEEEREREREFRDRRGGGRGGFRGGRGGRGGGRGGRGGFRGRSRDRDRDGHSRKRSRSRSRGGGGGDLRDRISRKRERLDSFRSDRRFRSRSRDRRDKHKEESSSRREKTSRSSRNEETSKYSDHRSHRRRSGERSKEGRSSHRALSPPPLSSSRHRDRSYSPPEVIIIKSSRHEPSSRHTEPSHKYEERKHAASSSYIERHSDQRRSDDR